MIRRNLCAASNSQAREPCDLRGHYPIATIADGGFKIAWRQSPF